MIGVTTDITCFTIPVLRIVPLRKHDDFIKCIFVPGTSFRKVKFPADDIYKAVVHLLGLIKNKLTRFKISRLTVNY